MITKITEALNKRNLSGWMVRETRVKSHQSFLALAERECTRRVDTTTYTITIHQKRGDVLGLSSFRLSKEGLPSFEKSLDDALFAAGLVSNQPFELPDAPKYLPEVEIFDATVNENSLTKFEDRLKAAVAKEKSTRLSAAEFFVDAVESRLVNHKGLDVNQRETRLHTEFILLSKAGKTEKEFIDRYSRRYIRDFDLEAQVRDSAQRAREATKASLPQTGAFPVILTDEPLDHIFNPVLARASARLKYNKMIQSEIGQSVTPGGDPKGDTVTLWSNSLLNRALGSSRYDSYGTPGRRICLIEKNNVKHFLADQRYGHYLNLPITGELGNLEVEGGSEAYQDLLSPAAMSVPVIYQLMAFSAFEPNAITGAFSAEIRAGYEITTRGKKPIKGGSVSGVLQRDLLNAYLSKEQTQRERALLPKGIFFQKLTLAGK